MTTLPLSPAPSLRPHALDDGHDREARLLLALAAVLLLSGGFHALVWALDGAPSLAGPVSWRKPIVFGLSSGVTTASVAWLVARLPRDLWRARWTKLYAVTMALEIALIDLQQWRGVPSHFNDATPLDGVIFSLMGMLICASVASVGVLGRRFASSASIPADTRVAGGAGVLLLLASSVVGAAMASRGNAAVLTGGGAMKLPHAIGLHALQTLPLLAWWLERQGVAPRRRLLLVQGATAAHALLFLGGLLFALGAR